MDIERKYYPIADAAKILGCTEADLIHLAAIGKLDLQEPVASTEIDSLTIYGADAPYDVVVERPFYRISTATAQSIEFGQKECGILFVMRNDIERMACNIEQQEPQLQAPGITGPTFAKLQAAIQAFDQAKPPRSKKAFMGILESNGCDTREQEVFASIAAEHYGHSWRT